MKIGLQIPNFTWPGGPAKIGQTLVEIARNADEHGFSDIWVMDHFFQIGSVGPKENEMMESYSTLSFIAAHTRAARLGTMVTGVVYRHPGILVKTVTTLDVLSGGRAFLGIGAAWNEVESRGLGVPFPPVKERFERLEETLQIALQMWSGNNGPYNGKHYQLAETLCIPQPLTKPHPPILIGGSGEQKTLRLVAKYADACNIFGNQGIEFVRSKLDVLKQRCDEVGRDYNAIEKTALATVNLAPGAMKTNDVIELCRSMASVGIQHMIFNMPNVHEIKPLETFGKEIIPAVSDM